jgi:hypothetical protein
MSQDHLGTFASVDLDFISLEMRSRTIWDTELLQSMASCLSQTQRSGSRVMQIGLLGTVFLSIFDFPKLLTL